MTALAMEVPFRDGSVVDAVSYTVTGGPANGQLELTTNPTVAITSFTQDDIDAGRLNYVHDGSDTTTDAFRAGNTGGGVRRGGPTRA